MGALAITNKQELGGLGLAPGKRYVRASVVFSDDYATGGDTVTHATLGLTNITEVWVLAAGSTQGRSVAASGFGFGVSAGGSATARTLVATAGGATPAEITAAVDLSAEGTVEVIFGGD